MGENKISPFIDFAGKWVVVTGASSGIGTAVVRQLAVLGANLILVGRNEDTLVKVANQQAKIKSKVLCLDLTSLADIQPAFEKIREQVDMIYGLCHAAGKVVTLPLRASNCAMSERMLQVNFHAGLEIARVISGRNSMEEGGSMVFISSVYAHVGAPGQIVYCASKGAVVAAVKAMAVELARRKIRVNSVSPGFVHTQMTQKSISQLSKAQVDAIIQAHPLGPGLPEDVARAVVFLLAPQSRWITGTDLIIDGGFTSH